MVCLVHKMLCRVSNIEPLVHADVHEDESYCEFVAIIIFIRK